MLRCVALRCVALRCVALRCVALRCVALRCVALRCVALRCVALRCVALRCIALYCILLYFIVLYQVSYPKAVDYWYSMCMLLVYGALVEFVLVNFVSTREKRLQRQLLAETDDETIEEQLCCEVVVVCGHPVNQSLFRSTGVVLTFSGC